MTNEEIFSKIKTFERPKKMYWKLALKNRSLDIGPKGFYDIGFDRLTDNDSDTFHDSWFSHLATTKDWVDMGDLFDAFIAAYGAAGLKPTENFFKNYKRSLKVYADQTYGIKVENLWRKKFRPEEKIFIKIGSYLPNSDGCVKDIITGMDSTP